MGFAILGAIGGASLGAVLRAVRVCTTADDSRGGIGATQVELVD